MGNLRKEVLLKGFPQKENQKIFEALIDSDLFDGIKSRNWENVATLLSRVLDKPFSAEDIIQFLEVE